MAAVRKSSAAHRWGYLWGESLKEGGGSEDLRVYVRIILKWILKKWDECGLDSFGSEWGPVLIVTNTVVNLGFHETRGHF